MGDRLYTKTANLISFVAGERVSADKFNSMNSFYSRTFKEISRAIGSVYDGGYPNSSRVGQESYLTSKWNPYQEGDREGRPLDILNLARIIGPASNLNPRFLYRGAKEIQETIPQGVSSYTTVYPASNLTSNLEGLIFSLQADLEIPSSYRFDSASSTLLFSEETSEEYTLSYETNSLNYEGGPNYLYSEFNVIPDPNDNAAKLAITDQGASTYLIELPVVTAQQAGLNNLADVEVITPDEPNNGVQLELPYWMAGQNLMVPGDIIPENSVYLKNKTTGDTYLTATYKYQSKNSLTIEGAELCIDEPDAHDFCLIVVGTDITTSIDDLRTKWFKHKHDGSFGEPRISVYDLSDRFKHLAPSGIYRSSELNWNYSPNYLHRDGYQQDADTINGSNAMRGSIFMGSTSFNGLDNISISGESSHEIFFGNTKKYIKANFNDLIINSDNDILINSDESVRVEGKEISLVAAGVGGGEIELRGGTKVLITNGLGANNSILLENDSTLISNTASESQIFSNNDGIFINSSMLLRKVKNSDRIMPSITSLENVLTDFVFNDLETSNIGYVKKTKVQEFIADWEPELEFELPTNSNEFEDLSNNSYKSLNGNWVSRYPYVYEGDVGLSGHAFLNNSNNEITLLDTNPNASYSINLSKILPGGENISPLNFNDIITIKFERLINLHRHIKNSNAGESESIENVFYFQINTPGRDFSLASVAGIWTKQVDIRINYSGYVMNGQFRLEEPQLSVDEISVDSVIVTVNGVKTNTFNETFNHLDPETHEWVLGGLFKENVLYKAKETYFNNKVWLEITG